MVVHLPDPQHRSCRSVHRVDVALLIRDVRRLRRTVPDIPPPAQRSDRHRRADAGARGEGPRNAAARCVERIDRPVLAADVQPPTGDGGLCPRRSGVRKSECPFELQPRHLGGGQTRLRGRLKVCVLRRGSPPVPERACGEIGKRRRTRASSGGRAGDGPAERSAREVFGHRAALGTAQRQTLIAHRSARERVDDCLGRAPAERLHGGRARIVGMVTGGASGSKQRRGIARSIRLTRERAAHQHRGYSRGGC